jgi:hypothetical protein
MLYDNLHPLLDYKIDGAPISVDIYINIYIR